MGVTVDGYKDILSVTVGVNETSKFWLGMLNDLKNRGIKDVLFFCVDGLPGFKEAIQAVFPSDTALEKMLYLASQNITKKWTQRYRGWDQVLGQLIILYDERLTQYL